jgi:hypothetical protein
MPWAGRGRRRRVESGRGPDARASARRSRGPSRGKSSTGAARPFAPFRPRRGDCRFTKGVYRSHVQAEGVAAPKWSAGAKPRWLSAAFVGGWGGVGVGGGSYVWITYGSHAPTNKMRPGWGGRGGALIGARPVARGRAAAARRGRGGRGPAPRRSLAGPLGPRRLSRVSWQSKEGSKGPKPPAPGRRPGARSRMQGARQRGAQALAPPQRSGRRPAVHGAVVRGHGPGGVLCAGLAGGPRGGRAPRRPDTGAPNLAAKRAWTGCGGGRGRGACGARRRRGQNWGLRRPLGREVGSLLFVKQPPPPLPRPARACAPARGRGRHGLQGRLWALQNPVLGAAQTPCHAWCRPAVGGRGVVAPRRGTWPGAAGGLRR